MDPLELFQNVWSSERWSKYVKGEVVKYWKKLLQENAASHPPLEMIVTSQLQLTSPHTIWTQAHHTGKSQTVCQYVKVHEKKTRPLSIPKSNAIEQFSKYKKLFWTEKMQHKSLQLDLEILAMPGED